jgi:DNA-directed RNA polymerase specialized sigma24 family protein
MARDGKMPELTDEQLEKQILESLRDQIPTNRMPAEWSNPSAIYAALAARLKADCLTFPDELPGRHGLVVEKVLDEMRLHDGQRNGVLTGIVVELDQHSSRPLAAASCVDFLRIFPLRALLPIIRARAEGSYRKHNVPADDISDQGAEVVRRILRQLNTGKAPDRNTGAFCATICDRVLADYGRNKKRNRVFTGDEADAGGQVESDDRPEWWAIENLSLDELDEKSRKIIMLRRCRYSLTEIAASVGVSARTVKRVIDDYRERS